MTEHSPSRAAAMPAWLWPFPNWLCRYPLLLIAAIAIVAMVWGIVGVAFGVPYLFWEESWWRQFVAAASVTWLLGNISYVGYLLAAEESWMKTPSGANRRLTWYLGVTWVPLILVGLVARVLIPAGGDGPFAQAFSPDTDYLEFLASHWPFAAGILAGAAGAVLLMSFLGKLQQRFLLKQLLRLPKIRAKIPKEMHEEVEKREAFFAPGKLRHSVPLVVQLHALAASYFGLLLLGFLVLVFVPAATVVVTPALAICVLAALVVNFYGMVRFHWPGAVNPILLGVALVAVLTSSVPYKHRYEGLPYDHKETLSTDTYAKRPHTGLQAEATFRAWRSFQSEHRGFIQGKPKLYVVAASGGGIRAAYWTAVVLRALEQNHPGFFYHVRLITGASGGMVGASHFVSQMDELRRYDKDNKLNVRETLSAAETSKRNQFIDEELRLVKALEAGALDQLAKAWVFTDIPRTLCPFAYHHDRGWALERAWKDGMNGSLDRTVQSLRGGEKEGWRPSLVFSPLMVEDGRQLLISNLDLADLTEIDGSIQKEETPANDQYCLPAIEFFRLFPNADEFKLSTAARMSASFPFASPVATLPTQPSRRVVDAGYYDNYGVKIAAAWIYANRDRITHKTSGVVLIQIRDEQGQKARNNLGEEDPEASRAERGLNELTTPLVGALGALESSMSFRNDEQLRFLSDYFNQNAQSPDHFTTIFFECPVKAQLNWSMTAREFASIRDGIDPKNVQDAIAAKNHRRMMSLKLGKKGK